MRKHSEENQVNSLLGLGHHSTRKSYYPELLKKIAELEKVNEGLEETVEERTNSLLDVNVILNEEIASKEKIEQQLKIAVSEAEQAKQSKDKYLAAASHDLLQPMNAARLLVSSLLERTKESHHQQLAERINLALAGAEELLQDLLEISKLDANATQLDITIFSIEQLLEPLVTEYLPMAQTKQVLFRYSVSSVFVRSDAHLLSRVIRNLISNAIRYTHRGRVLVGCRRRQNMLEIQVLDTGVGIDPDQKQHIFKEFLQLPNRSQGDNRGVGLGLAIVDRIAKLLGLVVRVESVPDKGSVFSVSVPLVDVKAEMRSFKPVPSVVNHLMFNDLKVLVIENDESIIFAMQNLLKDWGCEVAWLDDCDQRILDYIAQGRAPDIILSDYHLNSKSTGLDVLAQVKQGFAKDIPTILISADHSHELHLRCNSLGILRLKKPVNPSKLRALMHHSINI